MPSLKLGFVVLHLKIFVSRGDTRVGSYVVGRDGAKVPIMQEFDRVDHERARSQVTRFLSFINLLL